MGFGPGLRLDRRYVLVERIGLGGMSEVWRASDELLDRPVAVKALTPPIAPAVRAACRQEARAAARITHPHVTQVYDYGEAAITETDVVPFLVLELVDGENLAARLAGGPLPWQAAVWLTAQVASGLAAAHRIGVVHRDIKPGNVMLTASGAKILDFGIAALTDGRPAPDAGWLLGTPAYAAPERLLHWPAHPAADVYALGALCYEMLTGSPPIPAGSWREAAVRLQRPDPPARPRADGLPAPAADLCLACLSRDPAQRPAAGEIADALHAVLGVMVEFPLPGPRPVGASPGGRTLVDRLPPARQAGPMLRRAAMVAQSDQPAPRRAAMAARPAVPPDARPPAGRARMSSTAVGLAGAGAAALLAFAVVAAAVLGAPLPAAEHAAAPSPIATAPVAGAARPPTGPDDTPPELLATAARVVEQFDLLVADGSTDGRIRADAAADLRDAADQFRVSVAEGATPEQLRHRAGELRSRLAAHRQEGTVGTDISIQLDLMLATLLVEVAD
ncbi:MULTISPECIES: serine/threonine-protein kinase [unclassified Solwaraspora]|uniref:serine/threonine-protein kinase n=1 Tax=unclassified Solwaraspora TaxID=2627926 RepID=UPI00248D12BA|nr:MULTISPECIES: serine/threonine-protein kinase [unclassified Solwaraspora]WBC00014.1 serine/threonine-protein kinase [Solwaraspora sp. WMMA2059]WBC21440.1 serine/threonine-protein kinase [Solwaraspora sp. WMMA2080]WJK36480.1 serine/threonine-protein kinase [Solwaraspora sp. WMMA2065]